MAGIPISVLLERAGRINHIFVECAVDPEGRSQPDDPDQVEYMRNIERDFAGKAEAILDSLKPAHLKASMDK